MKNLLYVLPLAILISACNGHAPGSQLEYVNVTTPAASPTQDEQIQQVVDNENQYRLLLGQTVLSSGLSCSVQAVSSGQWLSSSSPGYNAGQGTLVTTGTSYSFLNTYGFNQQDQSGGQALGLLPAAIAPLFLSNFKMVCNGQLIVTETNYYGFDLASDDGSILTIDGVQVINLDGNHGIQHKVGSKLLKVGVHTFGLSFAQSGAGNFALILQSNGSLIDPKYYFH